MKFCSEGQGSSLIPHCMGHTPPPDSLGRDTGRRAVRIGFSAPDVFANPIAGPFVLGISSGAKLVVSLVMIVLLGRGISIGSAG